ncbi:MAG: hypothetical protein IPK26_25525 [Planctomycetes bacterium]|nr:hypothetical protein [Planctomycetota bacterium]
MVALTSLLLPIILSAVLVFVASSLIHMVLKYHASDYRRLANEDEVVAAVRRSGATPGQYIFPHCSDHKQLEQPEMKAKFEQGPLGVIYVKPHGPMNLGSFLGKWFAYSLIVSAAVAYLARAELPAGAPYLSVFRLVGTTTWFAYAWQGPADSIWKGKPWSCTFKDMFDGLVYALLTAGVFACLWPAAT